MDAQRLFKSFLARPAAAGCAPLLAMCDSCGLASAARSGNRGTGEARVVEYDRTRKSFQPNGSAPFVK